MELIKIKDDRKALYMDLLLIADINMPHCAVTHLLDKRSSIVSEG